MKYTENKLTVLDLFENHILKYIVQDLKILSSINPENGNGSCAIPQAIASFSAIDLIGYLCYPQDRRDLKMSFSHILANERYFPHFKQYSSNINFFNSFRDNIRGIMVHRYSIAKFDIIKSNEEILFFTANDRQIFNVSYFTKNVLEAINLIYNQIINDTFKINEFSNEDSLGKMADKIQKLKNFNENSPLTIELSKRTITAQTTSSLD